MTRTLGCVEQCLFGTAVSKTIVISCFFVKAIAAELECAHKSGQVVKQLLTAE